MRKTILIVDDAELNRALLSNMLDDSYTIIEAEDGEEAISIMEEQYEDVAAVLLDLVMPKMDGYDVLEIFNERSWIKKTPVIIISSEHEAESEIRCFKLGVTDFIKKPFNAALVSKRINNAIELVEYKNHLERKVEKQTKKLTQYAKKLNKMNSDLIELLGSMVESRDAESGEHVMRVKGYTKILATELMKRYKEYGLTPEKVQLITTASALHDVGKIAIPDSILLKPGRLTDEEFALMKEHSYKGYEFIQKAKKIWDKEYVKVSSDIAYYHHERYDGRGYPKGLREDEIPISAQIVSVADVYDALVSERYYKKAFPKDVAFNMIMNGECGCFSPKILDCFSRTRRKFEKIANKYDS